MACAFAYGRPRISARISLGWGGCSPRTLGQMPVWQVLVIVFLIFLNGFFAMSELAVLSSRRARLEQLADEKVRGARAALKLLEDPTRFLSTAQAGITLIGVFAGAYSGATLAGPLSAVLPWFGHYAYPVAL